MKETAGKEAKHSIQSNVALSMSLAFLAILFISCQSYSSGNVDDGGDEVVMQDDGDIVTGEMESDTSDEYRDDVDGNDGGDLDICSIDADGDGYISMEKCGGTDCCDDGTENSMGCYIDYAAGIHPGADEFCEDGIDQDCDDIDPHCDGRDADGDGYVNNLEGGSDCDDSDAGIHPGAEEMCDGVDQNCNGVADEGFDLNSDPQNCGACGIGCSSNQVCTNGECR